MTAREYVVGSVRIDGRAVRLRAHAVDRYIERVKPALDRPAAVEDLARLVQACARIDGAPGWMRGGDLSRLVSEFAQWLWIGDDVALPLLPSDDGGFLAVTCVARGHISESAQAHRAHMRRRPPRVSSRRVKGRERRDPKPWRNVLEVDAWD